jgi:hypothetical protein
MPDYLRPTAFRAAFIAASRLNRPTLPSGSSISAKRGTKVHTQFLGNMLFKK